LSSSMCPRAVCAMSTMSDWDTFAWLIFLYTQKIHHRPSPPYDSDQLNPRTTVFRHVRMLLSHQAYNACTQFGSLRLRWIAPTSGIESVGQSAHCCVAPTYHRYRERRLRCRFPKLWETLVVECHRRASSSIHEKFAASRYHSSNIVVVKVFFSK
jgi:hypothetical protein